MCPHLSFSHIHITVGNLRNRNTGNNDQPAKRLASSIPERQRGNNAEQYFINKECTVIPWGLKFTVLHASRADKGREKRNYHSLSPPETPAVYPPTLEHADMHTYKYDATHGISINTIQSTHAPGMHWDSSSGPLDANELQSLKSGRLPWPKVVLRLLSRFDRACLPMLLGRA